MDLVIMRQVIMRQLPFMLRQLRQFIILRLLRSMRLRLMDMPNLFTLRRDPGTFGLTATGMDMARVVFGGLGIGGGRGAVLNSDIADS